MREGIVQIMLLVACAGFTGCAKSLTSYNHLVRGSATTEGEAPIGPQAGVEITYLGVNGYCLRSRDAAVLIDPYFSRLSLARIAANADISANIERISEGLTRTRIPPRIDAILVTHGHFDHLLDVPEVQARRGGIVVASPSSCYLAMSAGVTQADVRPVLPGAQLHIGGVRVRALAASHDLLLGRVPYDGQVTEFLEEAPRKPRQWVTGTPLAFLIEMGGKRIYIDSGGEPGTTSDPAAAGVDLAILGVALPTSRERYPDAVASLRPRFVLPSHQDNMFLPLDDGFRFSAAANLEGVLTSHRRAGLEEHSELILLDYGRPWYVP